MSADYTGSRSFGNDMYPVNARYTTVLHERCEPLITPDLLKSRYLKSIPTVDDYTHEEIEDQINLAVNEFELETNLTITRVQRKQRVPFDRDLYRAFVYCKLEHGPITSVESMNVESSNGENIYKLPSTWLELGFAHKRQINLIPILTIFGAAGLKDGQASNAGLIFIQAINNFSWMPSFFSVEYTTGISNKDGQLPVIANHIIGLTAAIELLSELQSKNIYNSTSIGQDGISQSASSAGPQIYMARIGELTAKRDKLMKKLKAIFGQKHFLSNI